MRTAASRSVSSDSLRAVAMMSRRSFGLSRCRRVSISNVFALVRWRSSNQIISGRSRADALEHAARRPRSEAPACRGRSACRSDRRAGSVPGRRRAEPLGGRRDPRELLAVGLVDLPAIEERLLDGLAIGALQAVERVDGAGEAVERRRRAAVARAQRPHEPALVHLLADPLREAALADAGLADERDHPMLRRLPGADGQHDVHQLLALGLARDHRRRAKREEPGRERARRGNGAAHVRACDEGSGGGDAARSRRSPRASARDADGTAPRRGARRRRARSDATASSRAGAG